MRQGKYKQSLVWMGISIGLATLTGCATTAAKQRYDSPIPVYVDLTAPSPSLPASNQLSIHKNSQK